MSTIHIELNDDEVAEVTRRFEAAAPHPPGTTVEVWMRDQVLKGIRAWRIETLQQQLAGLAPVALDKPDVLQRFIADLQSA